MANKKISALPANAGLVGTETVEVVASGASEKSTTAAIAALATADGVTDTFVTETQTITVVNGIITAIEDL